MNRRALLGAGLAALGGVFRPELGRWYRQGSGQLWRVDAQRIFRPLGIDAMYTALGAAVPGDVVQLQPGIEYTREASRYWVDWEEERGHLYVTGLRFEIVQHFTYTTYRTTAWRGMQEAEAIRTAARFPREGPNGDWFDKPCILLTSVPGMDREIRIRFNARESAVRPDWSGAGDSAQGAAPGASRTPLAGRLLARPRGQPLPPRGYPGGSRLLPSDAETGGIGL